MVRRPSADPDPAADAGADPGPGAPPHSDAGATHRVEPGRRRTQQERTAESTQRLLTAAVELIVEKGFAGTSAAQISVRAGYSRSMVQFRWGTKEALLESLLRDEYERRLLPTNAAEHSGRTGLEQLISQIDHLDEETAQSPELMRGFFMLCFESIGPVQGLSEWISDWLERYTAATATAMSLGQADGSIRAELDAEIEAEAFVATGLGYSFRWMVAPDRITYAEYMRRWRHQVRAWTAV